METTKDNKLIVVLHFAFFKLYSSISAFLKSLWYSPISLNFGIDIYFFAAKLAKNNEGRKFPCGSHTDMRLPSKGTGVFLFMCVPSPALHTGLQDLIRNIAQSDQVLCACLAE